MSDNQIIALVTGASRGVGLGIAHELGLAGMTVYVTGRSRDDGNRTDDLPGTVDATARLVTESGGAGIAVPCDHTDDDAVTALAERIRGEHGRLDLLVNNVWGGYEDYDESLFNLPLEEQPIWRFDKMFQTGVRAHYTTTRAVAPLLRQSERGLVINISAGDEHKYLGDVQYDFAKEAVTRLGYALSRKLAPDGVLALTILPGFTRTERVEAEASADSLASTHTPRFVGRGVVALYNDPQLADRNGGSFKAGQLGLDYGFTDVDGSQPAPFEIPEV